MNKKAFTLIELVFVIVIAGILMTIAVPRFKKNDLDKAAEQIASHIRYTQHLAMQDDKFDPNDNFWFKKRWSITFNDTLIPDCGIDTGSTGTWKYSVYSDTSLSGHLNSPSEPASNPNKNGYYLSAGWSGISGSDCKKIDEDLNLGKKYNISRIWLNNCGASNVRTISFDELGRPMASVSTTGGGGSTRPYDRLLKQDCKITIQQTGWWHRKTITIAKETGYVSIM